MRAKHTRRRNLQVGHPRSQSRQHRSATRPSAEALANEEQHFHQDIKTVQFGWPLGMPLVRKLYKGLWEVRSRLPDRIARLVFTTGERQMILLHGFIKKSQKTPREDLELAKARLRLLH